MHDLIIIGGGPAAAAAAFYALEKQLDVLMVYEDLGGKVGQRESLISSDLDAGGSVTRRYVRRGDRELAEVMPALPATQLVKILMSHAMHGGQVVHDRVVGISHGAGFFSVEMLNQGVLSGRTVLVATGATPRVLAAPGADRLINQGMDYSIATYAQQVRGQRVAVIGSTQRALLGVAELTRTAAHIFLLVPDAAALATPLGAALHHQPKVEVLIGAEIISVCGNLALESLIVRCAGQTRRLPIERAFVDLGLVPNSDLVRGFVQTDDRGYIVVDQTNATTLPGLFAAGDVTTAAGEQALIAIGDGVRAAKSAYTYVLTDALTRAHHAARTSSGY
jgi:thioredoxin reductase